MLIGCALIYLLLAAFLASLHQTTTTPLDREPDSQNLVQNNTTSIFANAASIYFDQSYGPSHEGFSIIDLRGPSMLSDIVAKPLPSESYVICGSVNLDLLVGQMSAAGNWDKPNWNAPVGYTMLPIQDTATCTKALIQSSDGKMIAVGDTTDLTTGIQGTYVARFTTAGTLDTSTYGSAGITIITAPASGPPDNLQILFGRSAVIQPSNDFVITFGSYYTSMTRSQMLLTRFNSSGILDPAFGVLGKVFVENGMSSVAIGLALQSTEKIVIGYTTYSELDPPVIILQRLNNNGERDATFGTNGTTTFTSLEADAFSQVVQVQKDGANEDKILLTLYKDNQLYVARFSSDGVLDSSFGSSGITTINFDPLERPIVNSLSLAIDDNVDDILLAGSMTDSNSAFMVRLHANGAVDGEFGDLVERPGIQLIEPVEIDKPLRLSAVTFDNQNVPVAVGTTNDDFKLVSMRLRPEMSDFITLDSPTTAQSPLSTNQLYVSGTSSQSNTHVQVLIDDVEIAGHDIITNSRGEWTMGLTDPLSYNEHTVTANLIYDVETVLATDVAVITLIGQDVHGTARLDSLIANLG